MSNCAADTVADAQCLQQPAGRSWVLGAVMATMFMASVEGTVVATAMPTIVAKLGGFQLFSWVFTAYLLTQSITTPVYGRLADVYGRKRVLFAAIGVFVVGSALCGLAWNMVSLIVFRAIQGLGAGGLLPVSMTLVGDVYGPAERPRIQGYLSSVWASAAILGPPLGAYLVSHLSWPVVFWLNLPIAVVAVGILTVGLKERLHYKAHNLDILGAGLMMAGTALLVVALVESSTLPTGQLIALLAVSAMLLAMLARHERRTPEPLLPLGLAANRIIASGNLANLAFGAIIMAFSAFLPSYVQGVLGGSAMDSALALGLMTLAWPVGALFAGRVMIALSYRAASLAGALVMVAGGVLMATMAPERGLWWMDAGAVLTGLGLGLANNTTVVVVQASVSWDLRGAATSGFLFTRMLSQSMAAAVFGGILNAFVLPKVGADHSLVDRLMDPGARHDLPVAQLRGLVDAVAPAIHRIFLIEAGLALVVVIAALLLPKGLSPVRKGR